MNTIDRTDRPRLSKHRSDHLDKRGPMRRRLRRRVAQSGGTGPPPPRAGSADRARRAQRGDGSTRRDHRRRPAGRRGALGPARGGGPRRLDLLRRPARPARARHVRVCTGTACFAATGDAHVDDGRAGAWASSSASAPRTARVSLAETVCLGYCHASPAVRDGDVIDAGPGAIERLLAQATRDPLPSRVFASLLDEPVLTRTGDWSGLRAALRARPRSCSAAVKAADVRGRGGAGFPAGIKWEFAAQGQGRAQGDRGQRRRGRPGLLHRQAADGGQPAPAARGHGARGLRGRRRPRLRPRALRVPALQARAGRGDRRGPRRGPPRRALRHHGRSRAPAPTSSARRPRC